MICIYNIVIFGWFQSSHDQKWIKPPILRWLKTKGGVLLKLFSAQKLDTYVPFTEVVIPSDKLTVWYGKSPLFMGKSTINCNVQ